MVGHGDQQREQLVTLRNVVMREMEGEEEDILMEDERSFTARFHEIVGNCLVSLSDNDGNEISDPTVLKKAPNSMLIGDLFLCFLKVREVTVGTDLRWKAKCPNCKQVDPDTGEKTKPTMITVQFNLRDLKVLEFKGDPLVREKTCTTERGRSVVWKMMTGAMERELSKVRGRKKERGTAALSVRLKTVDGKPADYKILKRMPYMERLGIRKQFDDEGGVETDVDALCHMCGHRFKSQIKIASENFFGLSEEES
jgi:hypothetical protein